MTNSSNRLIKLFLILILLTSPVAIYAEAVQIDFLLSGMRDPLTDEPLSNGKVYTYDGGTSTPANLYLDREETLTAPNPIELDAYGRAIVFGEGIYRFIVKNASDTIIWSSDGLEYKAQTSTTDTYMTLDSGQWNADPGDGNAKIKNLAAGTNSGDAINKSQLDGVQSSLQTSIDNVQANVDSQTFLGLTDTPVAYGSPNDVAIVNSSSDALEFTHLSNILPEAATQSYPIGTATGDLSGEYPSPTVAKLQGTPVSNASPTTGQILSYDGSNWKPSQAAGGLTRYEAFSGNSSDITITKGVDYQGTPLFFAVKTSMFGGMSVMFDADLTSSLGYFRVVNHGGENADRNYDQVIYVTSTATSFTFTHQYIQKIIAYCQ